MTGEFTCNLCRQSFPDGAMLKSRFACKPCWRDYMRQKRYGITREQYRELYRAQRGRCAICGNTNEIPGTGKARQSLAVDHDRLSKRVRGLLCGSCNRGIGYLRHDPLVLARAARYIVGFEQPRAATDELREDSECA